MKQHSTTRSFLALLAALAGLASASAQAQIALPASSKVTADTSKPGFIWTIFGNNANQANSTQRTEDALAGRLKDADGNPLPNLADPAAQNAAIAPAAAPNPANAPITFEIATVINASQNQGESHGAFPDEDQMPGVPMTDGSADGMAVEILTYLDLPAGTITMGVNSDDGFQTKAGNINDALQSVTLGEFSGGRGAGDTIFTFTVAEAGVYPFRTIYEEGGGDANIEWFTVKADGTKVLINDTANGGIKAYRARVGSAAGDTSIKSIVPSPAPRQVNVVSSSVTIALADGDTKTVDDNSIVLQVDGQPVTTVKNRQGKSVTVTYTPAGLQIPTDKHTAQLTYKDSTGASRTESWTFYNLKNIVLPAAKVTEDFDSYPEDSQPTGWVATNFTAKCDDARDPASQTSASFENWVLVSVANAPSIDGGVLNVAPNQTFNGQPVTSISAGNILYAESDSRCGNGDPGDGSSWGQTQFIVSKPFDLSALTNVVLTFSSLYTQNQDSYGGAEYSIDGGNTWLPIVYFLDGPDIVLNGDGSVDAVSTFVNTNANRDTSGWFVNGAPKGAAPGGNGYGDAVAAPITQSLGLYIAPRVNDDQTEGARIEIFRLPAAGKQKDVRLRFGALGTDSWWFAIDNIAFYDVPSSGGSQPPPPTGGTNILSAADQIRPTSYNSPGAEIAPNVLDGKSATKYLNFDKLNTGVILIPANGTSILTGIGLTSANDAPERDPATFLIEGSNDLATWTKVADGAVAKFSARFARQQIDFANSAAYAAYRVTFPTVANAGTANSMQIADIELIGNLTGANANLKFPVGSLTASLAGGKLTITYKGILQSATTVNGKFADVANATNPYVVTPSGIAKFYRARE